MFFSALLRAAVRRSVKNVVKRTANSQRKLSRRIPDRSLDFIEYLEDRTLLALSFNFTYVNQAGASDDVGFNDPNAATRTTYRNMLETAAETLGTWFDHTATLDVDVLSYSDGGDTTLASASPRFSLPENPGFGNKGDAAHIVLGGTDPSGGDDMQIEVNFAPNYGQNLTVGGSQDDLIATLIHEIMHGLDFGSNVNFDGSSFFEDTDEWSAFDSFLTDKDGNRVISQNTFLLNSSTWTSVRTGGTSPAAGLFFDGPNAKAANGGNRVGLYSPGSWQEGSSASHVDDFNTGISAATYLMVANGILGKNARVLHPVEFGMMEDIGFNMIQPDFTVVETGGDNMVSEAGTTDTFTMALTTRPLSNVVIGIASPDTGEVTVDKSSLTFTPQNWNVPQTVTLTGVADGEVDTDQNLVINFTYTTKDDTYTFASNNNLLVTNVNTDVPIPAVTYVVDTHLDSVATDGKISLREAITAANTNLAFGDATGGSPNETDVITFASSLVGQTITLGGTQLTISDDLIITGLGADQLTIDANQMSRVFEVSLNTVVEFSGLTITGGDVSGTDANTSTAGAGILNRGTTSLEGVHIHTNSARTGAGILNFVGQLTISNSAINNNTASHQGGGININGEAAVLKIINSTISGNTATTGGGGIVIVSTTSVSEIVNSTITGNRANGGAFGGGIATSSTNVTLHNTIVAGNFQGATGTTPDDISGTVFNGSQNNIIGDAASSGGLTDSLSFPNNIVGVNGSGTRDITTILNTTLQNNGGPVPTHALVPTSIAINNGNSQLARDENNSLLTSDGRGAPFTRFGAGTGNADITVDIGAYEVQPRFVVNTLADETNDHSTFSLREAIDAANAQNIGANISNTPYDLITFESFLFDAPSDGTITLNGNQLVLLGKTEIRGPGSNSLNIDANSNSRLFHIKDGADVILSDMRLTGGDAFDSPGPANVPANFIGLGGAILNDRSTLVVRKVMITENSGNVGGAIINYGLGGTATLLVEQSSLTQNVVGASGGAIYNWGDQGTATATIIGSTLSGNSANAYGGGIYNWSNTATLNLVNSTVSGNSINTDLGAGIFNNSGSLNITNSTIALNRASANGTATTSTGGFYTTGSVLMHNSIVAGNLSGINNVPNDIAVGANGSLIGSNNLIGNAASSGGLTNGTNGNIVGNSGTGTIPLASILNPTLLDNGGPTRTHALVANSPAIDRGKSSLAVDHTMTKLTVDQRGAGFVRVQGFNVDMGAYEATGEMTTFTVDSITDVIDGNYAAGQVSLREAIEAANYVPGLQTIAFSSSIDGQTITLDHTLLEPVLTITETITIEGNGADKTIISGNSRTALFNIALESSGQEVGFSGLTLTEGKMDVFETGEANSDGGAIYNSNASLWLDGVQLLNNEGIFGGAIYSMGSELTIQNSLFQDNQAIEGGAISAYGQMTISDSRFTGNESLISGGAIYSAYFDDASNVIITGSLFSHNVSGANGGAIAMDISFETPSIIINSTFSENSAFADGGAIFNLEGALEIRNSTITGNVANVGDIASSGGGIWTYDDEYTDTTAFNTIIAGNFNSMTQPTADDIGSKALVASSANNLIGDADSAGGLTNGTNGNIVGVNGSGVRSIDTILDTTLRDNGGPTPTLALVLNSPALDAGSNSLALDAAGTALTYDQRGEFYNRISNSTVDIGAFEAAPARTFTVNGPGTAIVDDSFTTLAEAIQAASTNKVSGNALPGSVVYPDVINFDAGLTGTAIVLGANGLPAITDSLTINGLGSSNLTISGNTVSRVFLIDGLDQHIDVTLIGLRIANGVAPEGQSGGGISAQNADIDVRFTVFSGNASGAIDFNNGTLVRTSVVLNSLQTLSQSQVGSAYIPDGVGSNDVTVIPNALGSPSDADSTQNESFNLHWEHSLSSTMEELPSGQSLTSDVDYDSTLFAMTVSESSVLPASVESLLQWTVAKPDNIVSDETEALEDLNWDATLFGTLV